MLHQVAQPWSEADKRKLESDLWWRAADEIRRLRGVIARGVIARNCDNPKASPGDAAIIRAAKQAELAEFSRTNRKVAIDH
jgi:hypothetical protein